jgi:hypothetical protein
MIYFADISVSISFLLVLLGLGSLVFSFLLLPAPFEPKKDEDETTKSLKRAVKLFFSVGLFLFIIAALLPSKQAILLIAASQIGEKALQHQNVERIVNPGLTYVEEWLKVETNKLRQEKR